MCMPHATINPFKIHIGIQTKNNPIPFGISPDASFVVATLIAVAINAYVKGISNVNIPAKNLIVHFIILYFIVL